MTDTYLLVGRRNKRRIYGYLEVPRNFNIMELKDFTLTEAIIYLDKNNIPFKLKIGISGNLRFKEQTMFEKEAFEWTEKNISVGISMYNPSIEMYCGKAFQDGAEFGYNKGEQLTKARELLKKWVELYKPKLEGYPITPIQEQTEQFLNEVEK